MKKLTLIIVLIVLFADPSAFSQDKLQITPFLHQTGMYYSSDQITSDGFGLGAGVHFLHKTQVAGQVDVNLLWGNGNAVSTRIAAGYERRGVWAPGIYATLNLIWGHRVELLGETGDKPPMPAIAAGLRLTPLKFNTESGYVSALEFGYGMGPQKAMSLEFSVLSVGFRF